MVREPPRFFQFQFIIIIIIININLHNINKVPHAEDFRNKNRLLVVYYCFFFMNPSPSAQNPIPQPLKKANPSSHFTPPRPSIEGGMKKGILMNWNGR